VDPEIIATPQGVVAVSGSATLTAESATRFDTALT
jgi:hypothetical protein